MATLLDLPPEVIWQLYYHLPAPAAASLCTTHPNLKDFCRERKIRLQTLINYYGQMDEIARRSSMHTLLTKGKDARDVEHLQALVILHPKWLNQIKDRYTLNYDPSPIMAAALWQLGSDPLLPIPYKSNAYLQYFGVGSYTPILAVLSRNDKISFRLGLLTPRSRATIPERLWELLGGKTSRDLLHLPFPLAEQVSVNMLCSFVELKDFYGSRELLERGIDPTAKENYTRDKASPLTLAVRDSNEHYGDMLLWLLLHYISPDPARLSGLGTRNPLTH